MSNENEPVAFSPLGAGVFKFYDCGTEILGISPKGFYVRGVKVPQDDNEARAVYDAFIEWMEAGFRPVRTRRTTDDGKPL